jgi:hyperosmotically inducible protein
MNKAYFTAVVATTTLCFAAAAMGQSTGVPADNSKSNKLDSANTSASADAQKDNAMDRSLTQRIRQSVMADKTLSTYAHNVKIVSVNGTVTLNGVVRSEQEKSTVAAKAMSVAGDGKVVNDLKVSPKS